MSPLIIIIIMIIIVIIINLNVFSYTSNGKKEWKHWSLPYIFGSNLAGKIITKMIINGIT